jgi:hypothetical protein
MNRLKFQHPFPLHFSIEGGFVIKIGNPGFAGGLKRFDLSGNIIDNFRETKKPPVHVNRSKFKDRRHHMRDEKNLTHSVWE